MKSNNPNPQSIELYKDLVISVIGKKNCKDKFEVWSNQSEAGIFFINPLRKKYVLSM